MSRGPRANRARNGAARRIARDGESNINIILAGSSAGADPPPRVRHAAGGRRGSEDGRGARRASGAICFVPSDQSDFVLPAYASPLGTHAAGCGGAARHPSTVVSSAGTGWIGSAGIEEGVDGAEGLEGAVSDAESDGAESVAEGGGLESIIGAESAAEGGGLESIEGAGAGASAAFGLEGLGSETDGRGEGRSSHLRVLSSRSQKSQKGCS